MRISAWSSVVCSSDLRLLGRLAGSRGDVLRQREHHAPAGLVDKPGDDARGARLAVPEAKLREIDAAGFLHAIDEIVAGRSEESRVGTEGVSTCRSWWSTYQYKINI